LANPIDSLLETPDVLTQLAVQYGPRVLAATLVAAAASEINPAVVEIFQQRGIEIPVLKATNALA
jgi:hypothetical protein